MKLKYYLKSRINESKGVSPANYIRVLIRKYLPRVGQGNTLAQQYIAALNNLVYRWNNDGEAVEDCVGSYCDSGNVDHYANWLYNFVTFTPVKVSGHTSECFELVSKALKGIKRCNSEERYSYILGCILDYAIDEVVLNDLERYETHGNIFERNPRNAFFETPSYDENDNY